MTLDMESSKYDGYQGTYSFIITLVVTINEKKTEIFCLQCVQTVVAFVIIHHYQNIILLSHH